MMEGKLYLYAAREISSGKLVNDITTPKKKFWEIRAYAKRAISKYNNLYANRGRGKHSALELVVFELTEVQDGSID